MRLGLSTSPLIGLTTATGRAGVWRLASAVVLSGDNPLEENTLEHPHNLVPKKFTGAVSSARDGQSLQLTMPAWSLLVRDQ